MDVCASQALAEGADVPPTPAQLCRTATYDPYEDADMQTSVAKYDDYPTAPKLCRSLTYDPYEDVDVHHAFGWPVAMLGPVLLVPVPPCMIVCPSTVVGLGPLAASQLQRTTTYDVGVWQSDAWGGSTRTDDALVSGAVSNSEWDLSTRPRRGPSVRRGPTVLQRWSQIQARLDEINDPFLMSCVN